MLQFSSSSLLLIYRSLQSFQPSYLRQLFTIQPLRWIDYSSTLTLLQPLSTYPSNLEITPHSKLLRPLKNFRQTIIWPIPIQWTHQHCIHLLQFRRRFFLHNCTQKSRHVRLAAWSRCLGVMLSELWYSFTVEAQYFVVSVYESLLNLKAAQMVM